MVELTFKKLRIANVCVGIFQLVTSAVIFALGPYNARSKLPWYTFFIQSWSRDDGDAGFYEPAPDLVAQMPIALWSGIFLLLSGLDHLVVALPGVNRAYNRRLCANRNPFRWAEYAVSASCMSVMIGQLCGITSVFELTAIFGLTASCMLFGWQMELLNGDRLPTYAFTDDATASPALSGKAVADVAVAADAEAGIGADARDSNPVAPRAPAADAAAAVVAQGAKRVEWSPFVMGCFPFVVSMVIIWYYFFQAVSSGDPPAFVWSIVFILTGLYCTFAIVQVCQFKQARGFRGFAKAELWYIVLSLTSKQLLAWINYGGSQRFQSE